MNRFLPQGFNFSWRCLKPISRDSEVVEVIGIAADISKRKQYEQELKEAKDQLESFIQQSPDGIIVKELNGRIVKVNPAIERILGWSETELTSADFQNDHIPEDYVQELYELIEKIKQGDEVVGFETVRRRKDRVLIIIQLTLSTIKDHQGNIVRTSFVIRDITEIKKSLELLHKWERVSAIGELAAGIAHEIRNPLTTVKGFLQLLRKEKETAMYFDLMFEEIGRIEMLTNEFLMLAKPQADQMSLHNLLGLVEGAVLPLTQAVMNNIYIHLESTDEVYIYGNAQHLKQLFINVLKNAIESMPEGGDVWIRFDLDDLKQQVVIQIIDRGCGITEELIPKLGEPFFTLKGKGTGLGLMVSYKIIQEHRGEMHFESHVGSGTTVYITLPVIVSTR